MYIYNNLNESNLQDLSKLQPLSLSIKSPMLIRPISQPNPALNLPLHDTSQTPFLHLPTHTLPILISGEYHPSLPRKRPVHVRVPVLEPRLRVQQRQLGRPRREHLPPVLAVVEEPVQVGRVPVHRRLELPRPQARRVALPGREVEPYPGRGLERGLDPFLHAYLPGRVLRRLAHRHADHARLLHRGHLESDARREVLLRGPRAALAH